MTDGIDGNRSRAFNAMVKFLEQYWERGKSGDIAELLGSLSWLPDGGTADPAMWNDWVRAYNTSTSAKQVSFALPSADSE